MSLQASAIIPTRVRSAQFHFFLLWTSEILFPHPKENYTNRTVDLRLNGSELKDLQCFLPYFSFKRDWLAFLRLFNFVYRIRYPEMKEVDWVECDRKSLWLLSVSNIIAGFMWV